MKLLVQWLLLLTLPFSVQARNAINIAVPVSPLVLNAAVVPFLTQADLRIYIPDNCVVSCRPFAGNTITVSLPDELKSEFGCNPKKRFATANANRRKPDQPTVLKCPEF